MSFFEFLEHEVAALERSLHRYWRCHPRRHPWLIVNGVAIQLIPHREVKMSVPVTIGHTVTNTISYVDTAGNPMLTPVTPDSPPTWTESNSALDTFTVSADGLTATNVTSAAGTDTDTVTVIVGGVTYTASVDIVISAPPQTLGGVQIVSAVS